MPRKRRDIPWLDQRDNGVFYAYWYDAEHRRTRSCSLHTQDAGEAQTAFAQFLLNGRAVYESGEDGLSVAVCIDKYIGEHVRVKCAAPLRQEQAAAHLKAFFEGTLISDIDVPMSRAYAAARRAGEIGGGRRRADKRGSDSTIRRELTVLVAAANHAVLWKRLARDGLPSVELPAETSQETPWYDLEEVERLFGAVDDYLRRFVRIAYWTAGRKASVQGLLKQQVDLTNGRIHLRKPGEAVTVKRRAIVPLYDAIRPDVEWLMTMAEDDRLFGSRDFYRPYKKLCKYAGLADKSHPHILRHSRATHLLQKGTSIYDVAKLLGDTVVTVQKTYGHHSSEYLAETTGEM